MAYFQLAFMLIGGGAAGAVITALIQWYRNRVPIIRFSKELDRIFSTGDGGVINATAKVRHGEQAFDFENVSLVKVRLKNRSGHDYPTFTFGITIPEGFETFKLEVESKDRLHQVICQQSPTPVAGARELDFAATPFNRGDSVTAKLYVQSEHPIEPEQVEVGSAASVTLVESNTYDDAPKRMSEWMPLIAAIVTASVAAGSLNVAVSQLFSLNKDKTDAQIKADFEKERDEAARRQRIREEVFGKSETSLRLPSSRTEESDDEIRARIKRYRETEKREKKIREEIDREEKEQSDTPPATTAKQPTPGL